MPTLLTPPLTQTAPSHPRRKRWTRTECAGLQSMGLLDQRHYELVEGELIDRMGKNRPHVNSLVLLMTWLQQVFGASFVNPEAPIDVAPGDNPTSEPEPDLIVIKRDLSHYLSANPRPEDLRLLVEISDSTLAFDLGTKAPLYARAGIAEYWVLDIPARRLFVNRDPKAGKYQSISEYSEHEAVSPLSAPEAQFRPSLAFPA
jgi:Uma2 family endonuclease